MMTANKSRRLTIDFIVDLIKSKDCYGLFNVLQSHQSGTLNLPALIASYFSKGFFNLFPFRTLIAKALICPELEQILAFEL